jgi:hypothetical protein
MDLCWFVGCWCWVKGTGVWGVIIENPINFFSIYIRVVATLGGKEMK